MGYEKGSVFWYKNKFYLFMGYEVRNFKQYYLLKGIEGDILAEQDECSFILSPGEA